MFLVPKNACRGAAPNPKGARQLAERPTAKGKGGRPQKAPDELRTERLSGVRLTAAERHYVELMAERAGLSVAEFARRAFLGQNVRARRAAVEEQAILAVDRVGRNLHQIVKALHFKQGIPNDIAETIAEVRAVLQRVRRDGS